MHPPVQVEALHLAAADGAHLHGRCYWPTGEVQRAVLVAPAMGVMQRFYEPFCEWLASRGVAAFTLDFRGTGASAPPRMRGYQATLGDWAGQDLPALIAAMRLRCADLPFTWLGHSLGGQLFGMVPGADRFEHLLTYASGNGYWRYNSGALRWYVHVLWHVVAPLSIAAAGYFPGRRLGQIGDLPAGVMWQWRRWCTHPDYLATEGPEVVKRYAEVRVPIRAVLAQDDELLSPEGIRRLYPLYAHAPVHFETLVPAAHGLRRIGHFGLFLKSNGAALWPLVLRWIHDPRPEISTRRPEAGSFPPGDPACRTTS